MVSYNITVAGRQIENLFSVKTGRSETRKVGSAEIVCSNTNRNRQFESGDEVIVRKNGRIEFKGSLMKRPTAARNDPRITLEAWSKKAELKFEQVNRVFYNKDTGDVIRSAVSQEAFALNESTLHVGSDITNWSSNASVFELANITSQQLNERGGDLVFIGWRKNSSGSYSATYNVSESDLIGGGQLLRLKTRLMINDIGDQFNLVIELRDPSGNNYVWNDLSISSGTFDTFELKAEEATTNGAQLNRNSTLQYRFSIDGRLPEARAAVVDFASATFYGTTSRNPNINPSGVERTGNRITRRFEGSILQLLQDLETEDNFVSWVDDNDVLHYVSAGDQQSPQQINYFSTPVTEATFNRDYSQIANKVSVQGAGDIQVTLRDDSSIKFYGISPRHEPITDPNIQSREEAVRRGRGFLQKNAWDDTAMEFEIGSIEFGQIRVGQSLTVNWPPEDISSEFIVTDVETDEHGFATITVSGNV